MLSLRFSFYLLCTMVANRHCTRMAAPNPLPPNLPAFLGALHAPENATQESVYYERYASLLRHLFGVDDSASNFPIHFIIRHQYHPGQDGSRHHRATIDIAVTFTIEYRSQTSEPLLCAVVVANL